MISQGETVTIVCEAFNAKLYRMINNKRHKISEGLIRLCWLNDG